MLAGVNNGILCQNQGNNKFQDSPRNRGFSQCPSLHDIHHQYGFSLFKSVEDPESFKTGLKIDLTHFSFCFCSVLVGIIGLTSVVSLSNFTLLFSLIHDGQVGHVLKAT